MLIFPPCETDSFCVLLTRLLNCLRIKVCNRGVLNNRDAPVVCYDKFCQNRPQPVVSHPNQRVSDALPSLVVRINRQTRFMFGYCYYPYFFTCVFCCKLIYIQFFGGYIPTFLHNLCLCRFYRVISKVLDANHIESFVLYSDNYRTAIHIGNG